jgi:hypothetical protein
MELGLLGAVCRHLWAGATELGVLEPDLKTTSSSMSGATALEGSLAANDDATSEVL